MEILLYNIKNYIKNIYKIWKNRPILGNNKSIVAIYLQCGYMYNYTNLMNLMRLAGIEDTLNIL